MYNNIRELNVDDIEIKVFSKNPNEDQIDNIEGSVNNAYLSFHAAFCNNQECGGAQKINIYAANTEGEYKELLSEKGIDSSIKSHKFSALKDHSNGEFDIYFYLNRSGDFAYSTLERAVARVLIEGNDVFKSALPQALKTGMVDYVAGLDEIGNVQNNNEDCRDFNKIIKKNLSPYDILKDKKNEAQAEQVIKYLKQENPDKINELFKGLTTQDLENSKIVTENFLNELKDDDLNAKFSEWISKQLEQFHQKLAEKFVPKMESKIMADDTEVTVRYHQDSKMKDVDESVADTLKNFKDAFCSDGECNIPQKLNIFSFNSETDYSQYLCGNNKKSDKLFISNDKDGETSIYLYLKGKSDNKENNNIDTLNLRVIETIMKNNDWDHLPQKFREGVQNYILDSNNDNYKNIDLNEIKNFSFTPDYIMSEFGTRGDLSGQVIRYLIENKPDDMHQFLKSFNELQVKEKTKVEKIVSSFMGKLKDYAQEFSDWVGKELSRANNAKSEEELNPLIQIQEEESISMDQTQGQSTEGKQDFIDQIMSSSCITDLGIKPECKDKLEDLIKALKECSEESDYKTISEIVKTLPTIIRILPEISKIVPETVEIFSKISEELSKIAKTPLEGKDKTLSEIVKTLSEEVTTLPEVVKILSQAVKTLPGEEGKIPPEIVKILLEVVKTLPEVVKTLFEAVKILPETENEEDKTLPEIVTTLSEAVKILSQGAKTLPQEIETLFGIVKILSEIESEEEKTLPEIIETLPEIIETLPKIIETLPETIKTESISDIFNNFRKSLCSSQECHGAQKVNISTISGDEFRDLTKNESHYNKSGHFVASNNGDTVDIKLYVDYEKDHSVLDLGSGTFINPHCNSYVPSDLNIGHEYESNCAKAAQVMSFLIKRNPDHLVYLFEDLAKSGCNNGDQIMQELDNYYNSELQTWLESNPIA